MVNLPLGTKVTIKATMYAQKNCWVKERDRFERRYRRSTGQRTGVIAGVRALREGYTEYDNGYVCGFKQLNTIKVYLVAVSLREMARVLPEDVEVAETPEVQHG